MSIAKSLRKSGRLAMFSKGLGNLLNSLNQDDSLDEYLKAAAQTQNKIKKRFTSDPVIDKTTETDENGISFDVLGDIGADFTGNYEDANRGGLSDIADFVMKNLGNDVPANVKESALSGLDLTRQSMNKATPKKEAEKLYEIGVNEGLYDASGKEIVPPREKKPEEKYYKEGAWVLDENDELVWEPNENYKPPDPTGDDYYKDPTRLQGEVQEAISKISLIKSAKAGPDGMFKVPDPYGLGVYELTQEELTTLKEQVKNRYKSETNQLVKSQGLDDAVEDIRKLLKAHESDLDKSIEKFKELNPDYDKKKLQILKDYFTLELL